MNKVILFSDLYLPTFPFLEIPLYNELLRLNLNATYVLQEDDIRLTDPELYNEFSKTDLKIIKSAKDIGKVIDKNDVFVSRFCYKGIGERVANSAKAKGAKVFMYDTGGIDIRVRPAPAHYLTAKSKSLKSAALKKFPKQYKNIFTTGAIQYDVAASTSVDRDEFMKSYGLNPNKKLAILTPANPGEAWMKGLQDDYKEIVNIVQSKCPGYKLLIKCHPLDYLAKKQSQPGVIHKNQHYRGKGSWEVIAPEIPLVRPNEGYMAIKASDIVLNIRSSLAMEIPLFKKPLININRKKYTTNWPYMDGAMMDIELNDLPDLLNNQNYKVDEEKCKKYISNHCYSDDGRAYARTAKAIEKIIKGEV